MSSCLTKCSTRSTRSSRRGRSSTSPTRAGSTPRSSRPPAGAELSRPPALSSAGRERGGGLLIGGEERLDRDLGDGDVERRAEGRDRREERELAGVARSGEPEPEHDLAAGGLVVRCRRTGIGEDLPLQLQELWV